MPYEPMMYLHINYNALMSIRQTRPKWVVEEVPADDGDWWGTEKRKVFNCPVTNVRFTTHVIYGMGDDNNLVEAGYSIRWEGHKDKEVPPRIVETFADGFFPSIKAVIRVFEQLWMEHVLATRLGVPDWQ